MAGSVSGWCLGLVVIFFYSFLFKGNTEMYECLTVGGVRGRLFIQLAYTDSIYKRLGIEVSTMFPSLHLASGNDKLICGQLVFR